MASHSPRQSVAADPDNLEIKSDACDSESKPQPIVALSIDTRDEYATFGVDGCEDFKMVIASWAAGSRVANDPGYYCLPDSPVL